MKTTKTRLGTMVMLLAAGTFFVFAANAEDAAAPSASVAVDADAGTDADAAAAEPELPAYDKNPFSDEKTPQPEKDEWKDAPEVQFEKGSKKGGLFDRCNFYRLREWIRIRCDTSLAQITQMSGNGEDVAMKLDQLKEEWQTFPEGGELVFPVRRGDRRLFEWQTVEFGYKGANSVESLLVVSEMWLPGEDQPTIFAM